MSHVFTKDEATTVVRPEFGPWKWPEPAWVMTSNCAPVLDPLLGFGFGHRVNGDPAELAIAINFLETLYRNGYAVVKLDGEEDQEDAVGSKPFTAPELLSALKVERERSDDECVRLGEAAEAMVNAERGQSALYRRSLKMLAADGERAEQEERDELREFARLLLIECRQRGCHSPRFEQVARELHVESQEARP